MQVTEFKQTSSNSFRSNFIKSSEKKSVFSKEHGLQALWLLLALCLHFTSVNESVALYSHGWLWEFVREFCNWVIFLLIIVFITLENSYHWKLLNFNKSMPYLFFFLPSVLLLMFRVPSQRQIGNVLLCILLRRRIISP